MTPDPVILGDREALVLPAWVAVWLDAQLGSRRTAVRDLDLGLYRALVAIHEVALAERERVIGTSTPKPAEQRPDFYSTAMAATHLGIGERGVRQAIARGQLQAERIGRHWRIAREDCDGYRMRRAS